MPYTQGFGPDLADHYKKHVLQRGEFGNITMRQYENMADHFLGSPLDAATLECIRPDGDVVRYNDVTEEFGILGVGGVIKTYFKPSPAVHRFPTNLDYFHYRCTQ